MRCHFNRACLSLHACIMQILLIYIPSRVIPVRFPSPTANVFPQSGLTLLHRPLYSQSEPRETRILTFGSQVALNLVLLAVKFSKSLPWVPSQRYLKKAVLLVNIT